MKGITQHDMRDCGVACLATISNFYGLKIPLVRVREIAQVDKNGVSIYGLTMAANQLGFHTDALTGNLSELMNAIENREISYPFIAHVIMDQALEHYIVVKKILKKKIYIFDPAKGNITLTIDSFLSIWSGNMINIVPNDNFKPINMQKGYFSKYKSFFLQEGKVFTIIVLISMFMAAISIAGASLYQLIIDNYILNDRKSEKFHNFLDIFKIFSQNIDKLFLTVLLFYMFQAILYIIRGVLISKASNRIDGSFIKTFYNHLLRLPFSFFQDRDTGEIMSRFQDISNIRNIISEVGLTVAVDSIMLIVGILILINISLKMFVIISIMITFYIITVFIYKRPIKNINNEVMESHSKLNAISIEIISGMEAVKSFAGEKKVNQKLREKYTHFLSKSLRENTIQVSLSGLLFFIESVGALLSLWIGVKLVLNGQLSLGALISFETLMSFFTSPIKNLINLQPDLQRAFVSADRLNDVLEMKTEDVNFQEDKSCKIANSMINFSSVCFGYGYRETFLNNVNLMIHPGEKITLIGQSGSGKSTLGKLIAGFYLPVSGKILIGNVKLNEIPIEKIRKEIVYVPQDTIVFHSSIKENILYGVTDEIDQNYLDKIIHACMLNELIEKSFLGINGMISENGRNLSGGQRQIIALVRAMLMKPSILILDESTNQMDEKTQSRVLNNIFEICNDIICIHITHNVALAKYTDRLINIEELNSK